MPKHGKGKRKAAAKPLAVHSLDNRPRYRTPGVQGNAPHLPTPEPTPAVRTGNGGLAEEAVVLVLGSVTRTISDADILSLVDRIQERQSASKGRYSDDKEYNEEVYEESARREISDEGHFGGGP